MHLNPSMEEYAHNGIKVEDAYNLIKGGMYLNPSMHDGIKGRE